MKCDEYIKWENKYNEYKSMIDNNIITGQKALFVNKMLSSVDKYMKKHIAKCKVCKK